MIKDSVLIPIGVVTAGVGSANTFNWIALTYDVVGIIAAIVGTMLAGCTLYWRYKEHKRRMKDDEDGE